jgi:preprotein translocase subunit SecE
MGVRIPPPVQNNLNIMLKYFSEAFEELRSNVTWPAWDEVQKYTIIVALFSVIFALATWGVDLSFTKVLNGFFNLLKG